MAARLEKALPFHRLLLRPLQGMRVKLTYILALKARDSRAQGGGREAAEALGGNENESQALKGRDRKIVSPLRA
jgi:hypothetical protein